MQTAAKKSKQTKTRTTYVVCTYTVEEVKKEDDLHRIKCVRQAVCDHHSPAYNPHYNIISKIYRDQKTTTAAGSHNNKEDNIYIRMKTTSSSLSTSTKEACAAFFLYFFALLGAKCKNSVHCHLLPPPLSGWAAKLREAPHTNVWCRTFEKCDQCVSM